MRNAVIAFVVSVGLAGAAFAQHEAELEPANNNIANVASLQRGAKYFVNYCLGCHSAKYVRYNRLAQDLQLSEQHCGTCERACTAGQQCIDGVCRSGSCERDCPDGTPVCCGDGDGFCTSLETDVEDCGACGVHCGGEVVCVAGHCL